MNYWELVKLALPEATVVVAAFGVILIDFWALRGQPARLRMQLIGAFAAVGCLAGIVLLLLGHSQGRALEGMFVSTPLTQTVKIGLLLMTLFTALISTHESFTDHVGEYFSLLLFATVGLMFLVSAENLLMLFVSLELASLSLYLLAAFNKQNPHSAEAALKYFLFGGMAAAVTLFGLSIVYGLSASLDFGVIAAKLGSAGMDPLLALALIMTLAGFGFKIAAVPFHLWAPDTYQGAPTPSAALIASGSKLGSFFIFGKLAVMAFGGVAGSAAWRDFQTGWMPVLALFACCSMVLGNLAAIVQKDVRRLLAYSAIAHAGYALLAVLADQPHGFSALLYYMVTYGFTIIGAFGVVAIVEAHAGGSRFEHFAGLGRTAPLLSFCLLIFLLSLAGIPPLAGFFGKFNLFAAALNSSANRLGLLWLVGLGVGMSAVSLYYYLQVLKQVYVAQPGSNVSPVPAWSPAMVAVLLLAVSVLALGCYPDWLLQPLLAALPVAPK